MSRSRRALTIAIALMLVFSLATTAVAAVKIYEGKGVASARLGMRDSTAASKIGKVTKSYRDRSYAGRVVYRYCFGRKMKNGRYPLEMFSDKQRKVFQFSANTGSYVTTKGIKVGSTENALRKAYGSKLVKRDGSVYDRYTLGKAPATDFYVKGGKVSSIIVRAR
ncbi:MAG: hypothetical protein U1E26_11195 [Coriobacteriia bacterium]|nr:hypothetical protein [Coriobacteriia bacterium]